jgi:hypothetical protein
VCTIIPAWEVELVDGSWSKADPGKSMVPYLKNKLKAKGLGVYGSNGKP